MEIKEIRIASTWLKTLEIENSKFNSAFDFQLTEQDLEKAYRELNEKEYSKQDCIRKLKERLEKDEDILYRTDNSYLLRYLRFRKFNCDKAYNSLHNFYSLRIKQPECFALPPNLKTLLNHNFVTCLPYKDEEGRLLVWVNFRKWNPAEMSFGEVLLTIPAFFDIVLANPHGHIHGIVGIWDFQGFSVRHASQLIRSSMHLFAARILQDCYPHRLKHIFAINCNALMKTVYATARCLIKNKIVDRIHILGSDLTELHKHVNPAVLPKEYGGTLEESECNITDLIMDNLDYMKYERSFGFKRGNKLR